MRCCPNELDYLIDSGCHVVDVRDRLAIGLHMLFAMDIKHNGIY